MAKSDYYPNSDAQKLTFLDNYVTVLGANSAPVGLTSADVTAISNSRNDLRTAVNDKVAKKAAAQAASTACLTTDKRTEDLLRAQARRIKSHPAYTPALGEQLGIEGRRQTRTTPEGGIRPDLTATDVLNGEVTIAFAKNGHSGVEIRSRRGAETEFGFLARDTESPYVDTRPNLTSGPETRHYVAQYLQKDTLVAELSDELVVTVPGKA